MYTEDDTKGVGTIFLIRLVGKIFSFYSMNPSGAFMNGFADYKQFPKVESDSQSVAVPVTKVYKYTEVVDGQKLSEFSFTVQKERQFIVEMLDLIRQHITFEQ